MTEPMTDEQVDVDEPCACEDDCACWYHTDEAQNMVREIRRLRERVAEDDCEICWTSSWQPTPDGRECLCCMQHEEIRRLREENERLKAEKESVSSTWEKHHKAEIAKLRKVADAARIMSELYPGHTIDEALRELDEKG